MAECEWGPGPVEEVRQAHFVSGIEAPQSDRITVQTIIATLADEVVTLIK